MPSTDRRFLAENDCRPQNLREGRQINRTPAFVAVNWRANDPKRIERTPVRVNSNRRPSGCELTARAISMNADQS